MLVALTEKMPVSGGYRSVGVRRLRYDAAVALNLIRDALADRERPDVGRRPRSCSVFSRRHLSKNPSDGNATRCEVTESPKAS